MNTHSTTTHIDLVNKVAEQTGYDVTITHTDDTENTMSKSTITSREGSSIDVDTIGGDRGEIAVIHLPIRPDDNSRESYVFPITTPEEYEMAVDMILNDIERFFS